MFVFIVANTYHDGLRHLVNHSSYGLVSHRVPFECLEEISHHLWRACKELTKDKRQDIVVHRIDNHGDEDVHREAERLTDGAEVNLQRRTPLDEIPPANDKHRRVDDLLPSQTPIRIAVESQYDGGGARDDKSGKADDGHLALHHVLHHIGVGGNAQRRDKEGQEDEPRKVGQAGLLEEYGYPWRNGKQYKIDAETGDGIKPEDGIVVVIRGLFHVDDGRRKTARLQIARNSREDGNHTYWRPLLRSQHAT